jgi:hypothetical protein
MFEAVVRSLDLLLTILLNVNLNLEVLHGCHIC